MKHVARIALILGILAVVMVVGQLLGDALVEALK